MIKGECGTWALRKYILILTDAILINLSYIIAYCFRFDFDIPNYELMRFLNNAIIITVIYNYLLFIKVYGIT